VKRALDEVGGVDDRVIAEKVEARFLGGDVRDVGGVGRLPTAAVEVLRDRRGGEPEEGIGRAHPRRVAPGEVVVRRQDVHAAAGQRVQRRRHHRHERLALAGRELGELALVQGDGRQHLHVERPHAEGPGARLPGEGVGLGQDLAEGAAAGHRAPGRVEA
jgi:hypothetical protein